MPTARQLYPTLIEIQGAKEAEAIVAKIQDMVQRELLPRLPFWISEVQAEISRRDDLSWAEELDATIKQIKTRAQQIADEAIPLSETTFDRVNAWNQKEIEKIKAILPPEIAAKTGFSPGAIQSSLKKQWTKKYAGLITQVSDDTVSKVARSIYDGVIDGKSYRELEREILAKGPISGLIGHPPFDTAQKRSRLIARDQIGKLNGQIARQRQAAIGIDSYIWRTSLDERVRGNPGGHYPRAKPSHWAREGQVFKWSESPAEGHPGEAILCRCTAEPYIEGVTGTKGTPGGPGKVIKPAMSLGRRIKTLEKIAAGALNQATAAAAIAAEAAKMAGEALESTGAALSAVELAADDAAEALVKTATIKANTAAKTAGEQVGKAKDAVIKADAAALKADEVLTAKGASPAAKIQAEAAKAQADAAKAHLATITAMADKIDATAASVKQKMADIQVKKKANAAAKKAKASAALKAPAEVTQSTATAGISVKTWTGSGWVKIGEKTGSNPGAIYRDESGKQWLVKVMSEKHIANELLASKLYQAAGVDVANMAIVNDVLHNGKKVRGIAGEWIEGLASSENALKKAYQGKAGFIDGAGVDMWLANWDAVGLSMDNVAQNTAGEMIRIDLGASMKFRAQGTPKPFHADKVPELETFLDGTNDQISPILSKYSSDDITRSLSKVARMDDAAIDDIVDRVWVQTNLTTAERDTYKAALKGRRDIIKTEWVSRGGPELAGKEIPIAANSSQQVFHKTHDPFENFTAGDPIPGLSPAGAAFVQEGFDKTGKITMKKALQANGLEWDASKVTYPPDVVKDVNQWQDKATAAMTGKGPFPKPLDTPGIMAKVAKHEADMKAAKAAAQKAAEDLKWADILANLKKANAHVAQMAKMGSLGEMADNEKQAGQFLAVVVSDAGALSDPVKVSSAKSDVKAIQAKIASINADPAVKKMMDAAAKAYQGNLAAIVKKGKTVAPEVLHESIVNEEAGYRTVAGSRTYITTGDGLKIYHRPDSEYPVTLGLKRSTNEARDNWLDVAKSINGPTLTPDGIQRVVAGERMTEDKAQFLSKVQQTIRHYTGGGYSEINSIYRGLAASAGADAAEIQALDDAGDYIREHTTTKPFTVWRGADLGFLSRYITNNQQNLVGTILNEPSFMSTTTTHGAAFSEKTLLKIFVPPGSKAIPARHISIHDSEDEIIFPPGTRMFVRSHRKLKKDGTDNHDKAGEPWEDLLEVEIIPERPLKTSDITMANQKKGAISGN